MMQKVLYSGWLTKSPPERKAHGPWKLFKSQWRRRFFVLANMNASNVLPGMCPAQLEYFDSEKLTKRKGNINLSNCEQVLDHVESEYYRHIFVVKTTHRGQQRAYYLAADTEEEMGRWVNHLRSLLSLQEEGPVRFVPHSLRHSQSASIPSRVITTDNRRLMSTPVSSLSLESSGLLSPVSENIDPFDSTSQSGKSPEDYFPLVECSSGGAPTPAPRVLSPQFGSRNQSYQSSRQDSMLEYGNMASDDTSDRDSAYDYPPPRQISDRDSTYDYNFPPGSGSRDGSERDSAYDYPPNFLQRSSDGDHERPLWECESRQVEDSVGDTYDVLPPKSHYVRRNPSDVSHCDVGHDPCSADDVYDVPTLSSRTTNPLPPPKAHPVAPKLHRYINAAPTPVALNRTTLLPRVSTDDGAYLAMNSSDSANNMYMPMTEIDHSGGQPRRMRSVFQSPAHQKSEKPPKAPATLPRTFGKEGGILVAINPANDPLYSCYATKKTFSFKRRLPSPDSRGVVLPQKAGPLDGPSSSEDEDEDSSETNSVENSTSLESESRIDQVKPVVQYLDLDLDASPAQVSIGSSCSDSQDKIEYNEIDVERTKALFDAKLMLEKERNGSSHSES